MRACQAVAALAAVLAACGGPSSTGTIASSTTAPTSHPTANVDCVYRITFLSASVELAISGGGQAACNAFAAQFSAQASSSGGSIPAGTRITPGDRSAVTGTPVCTKDITSIHFAVYPAGGNTTAAQTFCAGFAGSASTSSSS